MSKRSMLPMLAVLMLAFSLLACKKDDDDPAPGSSRDVKLEITGNYAGSLQITYFTAGGGATVETTSSLPWSKNITYASSVSAIGLTVGGSGGTKGQTVTVKIYAGGKEVSSTPGTATDAGIVVVSTPTYIF